VNRLLHMATFHLERLLLRGARYRLLVMALSVVAVSFFGGLALVLLGEPEPLGEAVWWAFLRLTDPGYLGDDEGLGRRVVSTVITVLGYVLFMGALIAILAQALAETVTRLQRGETPIALRGHILVLGLSEQTPVLLEELLRSEVRVRRFLKRQGAGRLVLVVLVEELDESISADLSERLGDLWEDSAIVLRTGSPLIADHLDRVAFTQAAAILVPGRGTHEGALRTTDAVTVKTVLSIANHPAVAGASNPPRIVAEVADGRLLDVVRAAYPGPLELIATDDLIARWIAQNLRHPGLSWILGELLAFHQGKELYYVPVGDLGGTRFGEAAMRMGGGVAIGVVRRTDGGWRPHLNPPRKFLLDPEDRWVVIAAGLEHITFGPPNPKPHTARTAPAPWAHWPQPRKVLVLGWGRRVALLLAELARFPAERFDVEVLSVLPVADRESELAHVPLAQSSLRVVHRMGDYTNVRDLAELNYHAFDNVVIVGRGCEEDRSASDAQTILCYTIVQAQLRGAPSRPPLLVEIMDPDNAGLFEERPGEVLLSPTVMAHLLAHVALRTELHGVADELLGERGAEFHFRPLGDYGIDPNTPASLVFSDLQHTAAEHGEILVGVRSSHAPLDVRSDLDLAPEPDTRFQAGPGVLLLVLADSRARLGAQ
jgi:hypothetical protein